VLEPMGKPFGLPMMADLSRLGGIEATVPWDGW
jgi:hypothetical protein